MSRVAVKGAVDGPMPLLLKTRLALAIPSDWSAEKKLLAQILAEYDHAHNPENWNTIPFEYNPNPQDHEPYIIAWADFLFLRNPQLVPQLIQEWNNLPDENSRADCCGVNGVLSDLLCPEFIHFT